MSKRILIISSILLTIGNMNTISAQKKNTKQIGFDFFIQWLDTALIDRKGDTVSFNKANHKIYLLDKSENDDEINIACCKYSNPDFITINSSASKSPYFKFTSESSTIPISFKGKNIRRSTFEEFNKTHLSGDIIAVMFGSFTLNNYTYLHIYFGFGDWIHHDLYLKLNTQGEVIDHVTCTGVE